jgi:hypothetical protein
MLARSAEIRVLQGRVFVSHVWGEAIARLTLATAHGTLIVTSNTVLCLEASPQKTRITTVSGSAGFCPRNTSELTRIEPGFVGEWSATASDLIPAQDDAGAQQIVQEALAVQQALRDLASRRRNILPRQAAP